MYTVVLVRHGQSVWNQENRFAGWVDVDLTPSGSREATAAGQLLKDNGFGFDVGYTSYLRRAAKSLEILLEAMDLLWIPEQKAWQLNERHYGALQGQNRAEVLKRVGRAQFDLWRRSYSVRPPRLVKVDDGTTGLPDRYASAAPGLPPSGESLLDCSARVLAYWSVEIVPQVLSGARVLICAHGSTLRALLKHLKGLSDLEIARWNIPSAMPMVLTLDQGFRLVDHSYLGDSSEVQEKIDAVAAQGKEFL